MTKPLTRQQEWRRRNPRRYLAHLYTQPASNTSHFGRIASERRLQTCGAIHLRPMVQRNPRFAWLRAGAMREALNEVAWQQEEALGVALEWRQATCGKVGGDLVPLPWRKAFGAALSDAPDAQEQVNVLEPLTGDTCGVPGFTDRALVFDDGIIDRHGSLHCELRLQASHARVQCFMHPPRLHPGVVFNFALSGETGAWAIAQDMIKLEFRE